MQITVQLGVLQVADFFGGVLVLRQAEQQLQWDQHSQQVWIVK